ncbi:MAG: [FeFe] hydrogenase H-cluster radical SAM maturase HydE [Candidatus Altiarchaeota archaeon]
MKKDADNFLRSIISACGDAELSGIRAKSERITSEFVGDKVYFRGVIEFSNTCEKDCFYCGIRKSNHRLSRYLMSKEEIVRQAMWAFDNGYGSVVLQGGEVKDRDFIGFVVNLLSEIKKKSVKKDPKGKGLALVVSVGEQKKKTYEEFFQAGAHRYLLRIETSDPKLYSKIHPRNRSFRKRVKCLEALKEIGFQVGSGVMIGLPSQTIEDLVNDVLFFKERDIDMIGMGPYVVHKDTPLGKIYGGEWNSKKNEIFQLSLNMIAACRIFLKDVNIASTTALQAMNPAGRELGLMYGANVIMPIITPKEYRSRYLLYDNKPCIDEDALQCMTCLTRRVNSTGKEVALYEWGDPVHFSRRQAKTPK